MSTRRDTRLFRLTREGLTVTHWGRTTVYKSRYEYGDRRVASAKCGAGGYSYKYGGIIKVEATNAEATDGWTDVTSEFLK